MFLNSGGCEEEVSCGSSQDTQGLFRLSGNQEVVCRRTRELLFEMESRVYHEK